MKLRDLVINLVDIQSKHGGDLEVMVDTEAQKFPYHLIPFSDEVLVQEVPGEDGEDELIALFSVPYYGG